VLESVRPFCDPRYAVDIFKLEPPGAIHNVPEPDGRDASTLQAAYDRMAAMLPRPWVMLSAGAGPADFERSLHYAYRAGASGYLAGRAIWWEPFRHFPDLRQIESALASDSVSVLERLDALTSASAVPWHALGGVGSLAEVDDPSFPAAYGP
jgi:tagatose 1,6-diphosphate aldolase